MKTRYYAAEQPHAVPRQSYMTRGIFDPDVMASPEIFIGEGEEEPVPVGSTAQNGFQEVRWFRCNFCGEVLRETHVDSHVCPED